MTYLLVQAESRGLSAFLSLLMPDHVRRFRVRAGPSSSNVAPSRSLPFGGRERARHHPPHCIGALRGSAPFEGVAGDGAAAPAQAQAQGKAFPSR